MELTTSAIPIIIVSKKTTRSTPLRDLYEVMEPPTELDKPPPLP